MLQQILELFTFSFIWRAVIVGLLISLCSALVGVSLVLKRYSMIGDGLSHVGFGSLAVALVLNLSPLYVAIPTVCASAFLLLKLKTHGKLKGDAAIALLSTGALAIGVFIVSVSGLNTDVNAYLFGSILTLTKSDLVISIIISAITITLFILFYNKIFSVTFDSDFAKATGIKTGVYDIMLSLLTSLIIVIGMRMMGAMLISSLLVFPAVTSMRLFKSYKQVVISSAISSCTCFIMGFLISLIFSAPTGASIVIVNLCVFVTFTLISLIKSKLKI